MYLAATYSANASVSNDLRRKSPPNGSNNGSARGKELMQALFVRRIDLAEDDVILSRIARPFAIR
jgi:hypothetical protein